MGIPLYPYYPGTSHAQSAPVANPITAILSQCKFYKYRSQLPPNYIQFVQNKLNRLGLGGVKDMSSVVYACAASMQNLLGSCNEVSILVEMTEYSNRFMSARCIDFSKRGAWWMNLFLAIAAVIAPERYGELVKGIWISDWEADVVKCVWEWKKNIQECLIREDDDGDEEGEGCGADDEDDPDEYEYEEDEEDEEEIEDQPEMAQRWNGRHG